MRMHVQGCIVVTEWWQANDDQSIILCRNAPSKCTASELAEHRDGGHMPPRPWCEECAEAFGREVAHEAHDRVHGRHIAVVSLDYLFFTRKGVFRNHRHLMIKTKNGLVQLAKKVGSTPPPEEVAPL